jgi:hypothetical protein
MTKYNRTAGFWERVRLCFLGIRYYRAPDQRMNQLKALQSALKASKNSKERAELIQLTQDLLAGRQLTRSQQWLVDYLNFLNSDPGNQT